MSIDIKILKSSCCKTSGSVKKKLKAASANTDTDIRIETLSDLQETMKYGVMNFPSIVVDGKVYGNDEINELQSLEQILEQHSIQ